MRRMSSRTVPQRMWRKLKWQLLHVPLWGLQDQHRLGSLQHLRRVSCRALPQRLRRRRKWQLQHMRRVSGRTIPQWLRRKLKWQLLHVFFWNVQDQRRLGQLHQLPERKVFTPSRCHDMFRLPGQLAVASRSRCLPVYRGVPDLRRWLMPGLSSRHTQEYNGQWALHKLCRRHVFHGHWCHFIKCLRVLPYQLTVAPGQHWHQRLPMQLGIRWT